MDLGLLFTHLCFRKARKLIAYQFWEYNQKAHHRYTIQLLNYEL